MNVHMNIQNYSYINKLQVIETIRFKIKVKTNRNIHIYIIVDININISIMIRINNLSLISIRKYSMFITISSWGGHRLGILDRVLVR